MPNTILSWPVNTATRAEELVRRGVDGLIGDRPGVILPVVAAESR